MLPCFDSYSTTTPRAAVHRRSVRGAATALCGLASFGAAFLGAPPDARAGAAQAQERGFDGRQTGGFEREFQRRIPGASPFGVASRPEAPNACAHHGPGFQAIAGSSTCVKIDGRMRVDVGAGASQWRVAPAAGAATRAAAPGLGPAPAGVGGSHVRLPRGY
jgi:hypothetical protein